MDLESLRAIVRSGRKQRKLSQEQAAEEAGVSKDEWVNLELANNSRRTAIRLPQDLELMNRVARVLGRPSGEALLKEARVL